MNEIKVKDVMTHLVVMAHESDPLQQLAGRLVRNRISGVPVVRDGKVVGVVSEMDIAQALAGPAHVDHGLEATDVMSKPPVTIRADESLFEAARLMDRHGIKRLPVVEEDGFLVGIISRGDLVRAMTRGDREVRSVLGGAL